MWWLTCAIGKLSYPKKAVGREWRQPLSPVPAATTFNLHPADG
ncbi:hypothetical protein [Shewanella baltica]|nr:hypothetical protein [Shewanella baltica]